MKAFCLAVILCIGLLAYAKAQVYMPPVHDRFDRSLSFQSLEMGRLVYGYYGIYPGYSMSGFYLPSWPLPLYGSWHTFYFLDESAALQGNTRSGTYDSEVAPLWKPVGYEVYDWCGAAPRERSQDPLTERAISTPAERGESVIIFSPGRTSGNEEGNFPAPRRTVPGRSPRQGHPQAFPH